MKKSLLSCALIALLVSPPTYVHADNDAVLSKKLQKIVNNYYKKYRDKEKFTAISASVLIPNDKKVVKTLVAGTIGFPPLSQKITPNNLFDLGSITKSFTALILLQLQAEEKLSLDDHLGKWLPQYVQWKDVKLRQLLNMTSSIPNYSADEGFLKKLYDNLGYVWSDEELLGYAHPEKPLIINEDSLFEYSNSNYVLAAMVIEKVTNDSFENQLQLRILSQQNNLKNSFYPAGPGGVEVGKAILDRRAHGYYYDHITNKSVDTTTDNLSWGAAAGAIVANTEDVVQWVQLLYHGKLIASQYREKSLSELESIVSCKNGHPIPTVNEQDPAGFGLGVAYIYDKNLQQRFWFYEGSTLGFRMAYFWSPCNDVTTIVALNSKAGEGEPYSKMGDHINEVNSKLYQAIIQKNPHLNCKN